MSANPLLHHLNPRTRAHLAAATPAFNINDFLASLPPSAQARQPVPNATNARQTVPHLAPAQNEPKPAPQPHPNFANPISPSSIDSPSSAPTRQPVPNSANARQNHSYFQTKPIKPNRPPRPLTPDQLRAASLLVAGHSTNAIAAALNINRHTLARWKRRPLFQQELRRLIRQPMVHR